MINCDFLLLSEDVFCLLCAVKSRVRQIVEAVKPSLCSSLREVKCRHLKTQNESPSRSKLNYDYSGRGRQTNSRKNRAIQPIHSYES